MHPDQINTAAYGRTEEDRREILRGYYAAVSSMDESIGLVLERLEELGIREETLIVFTSDNGMNMGHHGVYGKGNGTFPQNMYDTSVKVPFIINQKGKIPNGEVKEALCSHYDVIHTLLESLGIDYRLNSLPGKSLWPLISGQSLQVSEDVVIYDEYGPVRMIRDRDWKYVHRYPYGPHELYYLAEDPMEKKNLIDVREMDHKTIEMRRRLEGWFSQYVDPSIDGVKEPVYGKGQLDYAGVRSRQKNAYATDYYYLEDKDYE